MYVVATTRLDAGLSIVPIAPEKKAPSVVDDRTRQSIEITWTRWQSQYAKPGTLRNWFPRGQLMGIGIVCGAVSGLAINGTTYGLEVLDIDAADTLIAFESQLAAAGHLNLLERLPKERTPGGGAHFPYRCDVFQGNQVLARRRLDVDEQGHVVIKTIIETRGTGGQVVASPTPPGIHPVYPELGYTLERGSWESVPIISREARELLFACARSLNEYVPRNEYPDQGAIEYSNDSPGNDYNARVTDEEVLNLLGKHGWTPAPSHNGVVYLTRSGKSPKEGHSATYGFVAPKVLFVFSNNAHPFQGAHDGKQGTPYDPFGVFARLEHGGDFHAAATALVERGYGPAKDVSLASATSMNGQPYEPVPSSVGLTLTRLGDLLDEPEETASWLVDGLLPSGGFSLLAAKPKVGKSTLARCLAFAVSTGGLFLGRATTQGAVIYLALEEKRAEVRRHFKAMGAAGDEDIYIYAATAPLDALERVKVAVQEYAPVLLIIDPLFRMTRVRDSNDYAQVTGALEPLMALARVSGCHVQVVHHMGKADRNGADGILGSTAIRAAVDTSVVLKKMERYRTVYSEQRYGEDLEETTLRFDTTTRTVALGESRVHEDTTRMKAAVMEWLTGQDGPRTEAEVKVGVEGDNRPKQVALRELANTGHVVRIGKGTRGDPFKYAYQETLDYPST